MGEEVSQKPEEKEDENRAKAPRTPLGFVVDSHHLGYGGFTWTRWGDGLHECSFVLRGVRLVKVEDKELPVGPDLPSKPGAESWEECNVEIRLPPFDERAGKGHSFSDYLVWTYMANNAGPIPATAPIESESEHLLSSWKWKNSDE